MKKFKLLPPALLSLAVLTYAADTTAVRLKIDQLSAEIGQRYCPDKRVSIWQISTSFSGDTVKVTGRTDSEDARYELVKQLQSELGTPVETRIRLLPEETVGGKNFGLAENSILTLRSGPSVFQDVVSQTLRGLPLEILDKNNGFYLVRTDDGYLGWASTDRVQSGNAALKERWENSPKVVFVGIEGMIYSEGSLKSTPVADVVMGNRFILLERNRRWCKVELPDERIGWIPVRQVEDYDIYKNRKPSVKSVLKTAESLMGRPYFWGGASTKAMDCSGFVQTVFRQNGMLLDRDASMQAMQGSAVDTAGALISLKPGDLLFFSPYPNRITHVGIYIGDYSYIHCSGRVRINSFDKKDFNYNDYRFHSLRKVQRVIPE